MSIFTALADALAPFVGGSVAAGVLLGSALTISLFIAIHLVVGDREGPNGMLFIVSVSLGVVIATMVGWFPLWVPIFIALIVAFVIVKPFADGTGG